MAKLIPVVAVRDAVHFPGLVNTLHIVRSPSVQAIQVASAGNGEVVVLSQKDMAVDNPTPADLSTAGVLSETLQIASMPDGSLRVSLRGLNRVKAQRIVERRGCFFADAKVMAEIPASGDIAEALVRTAIEGFTKVVECNHDIPPESLDAVVHMSDTGRLADLILHHLPIRTEEKQRLLEECDHEIRLRKTIEAVAREERILTLQTTIRGEVERELAASHREYYLREQIRVIQRELDGGASPEGEYEQISKLASETALTPVAEHRVQQELSRLRYAPEGSQEFFSIRSYLEVLLDTPWSRFTKDRLDLKEAKRSLDKTHFGLEEVKDRVLDYLAVKKLKGNGASSVLCFVGPPGVGKTSVGKSIAEAMDRKFASISLGGVRDEAELRGHRRAYVGSTPGRLIQAYRQCGSRNPVLVLDEVDKLAQGAAGDPMSVLLEVLEQQQSRKFTDHFLDIPFDLSETIFIVTANVIDPIPAPLRDRLDVLTFPALSESERLTIAGEFLLPKAISDVGLQLTQLTVTDGALISMAREYTREAGVRGMGKLISRICSKAARLFSEGRECPMVVEREDLLWLLGRPEFVNSRNALTSTIGQANGLVVSELGGGTIGVEAVLLPAFGSRPELKLTGQLGSVMQESAMAAHTFLQSKLKEPQLRDVHVHVAQAAVPKEGPSAGLTVLLALASAYRQRPIRAELACSGEITLAGRVLPVGGIRDKVLAAEAAGLLEVILPSANAADLQELPADVLKCLKIHLVDTAEEALEIAFPVGEGIAR